MPRKLCLIYPPRKQNRIKPFPKSQNYSLTDYFKIKIPQDSLNNDYLYKKKQFHV